MRFILAAAFVTAGSGAALAELQVCNDSGVARSLAIGYGSEDKWVSEGWWNIAAGDCKVVIEGPLKNRYIYWRATAAGEDFPDERYMFCTKVEPFTIEGAEDCTARGYDQAGFKVADTGTTEPDYTLMLTAANSAPATGTSGTTDPEKAAPEKTAPDADAGQAAAPEPKTTPKASGATEGNGARKPAGFVGPVPAAGPAFTPGQGGEPFTQSAVMQGCGPSDGGLQCMLYAEGWRYIVRPNGVTPAAILDTLFTLAPNTPVTIIGEIVSQGDISAEVNLSQIEPGPADPFAALRAGIQGSWVSTEDPQSKMKIVGSEMTEIYGTEEMGTSIITLSTTCAEDGREVGQALNIADPAYQDDPPRCWGVDEVAADSLTFTYVARGNTLAFRRQ